MLLTPVCCCLSWTMLGGKWWTNGEEEEESWRFGRERGSGLLMGFWSEFFSPTPPFPEGSCWCVVKLPGSVSWLSLPDCTKSRGGRRGKGRDCCCSPFSIISLVETRRFRNEGEVVV